MAAVAISNFKNFNIWSSDRNRVQYLMLCTHQISLKSNDFTLRYGDITIFKMAAVRRLGF